MSSLAEVILLGPEEEARRLLDRDPAALGPNVALRPLLEDFVFPHAARVAGPTELLYHDELAPAYEVLGIYRPRLVPRLSATRPSATITPS